MTDPAFAIKNEVQQLVDVQIDTLRKPALLTSSELVGTCQSKHTVDRLIRSQRDFTT
jgi:hypothetical protein